jgi:hypothetical protein
MRKISFVLVCMVGYTAIFAPLFAKVSFHASFYIASHFSLVPDLGDYIRFK